MQEDTRPTDGVWESSPLSYFLFLFSLFPLSLHCTWGAHRLWSCLSEYGQMWVPLLGLRAGKAALGSLCQGFHQCNAIAEMIHSFSLWDLFTWDMRWTKLGWSRDQSGILRRWAKSLLVHVVLLFWVLYAGTGSCAGSGCLWGAAQTCITTFVGGTSGISLLHPALWRTGQPQH